MGISQLQGHIYPFWPKGNQIWEIVHFLLNPYWAPTSSSCGGLVACGHLEGPLGPPDPTPSPQVTIGGPQVSVK